jgi:hypothetical protein
LFGTSTGVYSGTNAHQFQLGAQYLLIERKTKAEEAPTRLLGFCFWIK